MSGGGASVWVVSMGHLLGLFDAPFLGMRPTRRGTMLRYAEFNRVEGDQIVDSTVFLDVMNLMAQVGAEVMVPSTAPMMVTPASLLIPLTSFDAVCSALNSGWIVFCFGSSASLTYLRMPLFLTTR